MVIQFEDPGPLLAWTRHRESLPRLKPVHVQVLRSAASVCSAPRVVWLRGARFSSKAAIVATTRIASRRKGERAGTSMPVKVAAELDALTGPFDTPTRDASHATGRYACPPPVVGPAPMQ